MNIIFSHSGKAEKIKVQSTQGAGLLNGSTADLDCYLFNEYPEGFIIEDHLRENEVGECLKCKNSIHSKHSEFFEKETSKLYKTCNKYKTKLEIIRENISNLIKENEEEDAFFEDQKESAALQVDYPTALQVDKRIILDDLLEEEEIDLPPLGFF